MALFRRMDKVRMYLLLFGPFLFLCFLSPFGLLLVSLILERFFFRPEVPVPPSRASGVEARSRGSAD